MQSGDGLESGGSVPRSGHGPGPDVPPRTRRPGGRRTLAGLVAALALIMIGLAVGPSALRPRASPGGGATGEPGTAAASTAPPSAVPSPTARPTTVPAPTPAATPVPLEAVPVVPVADFRSSADSIGAADVAAVLAGTSRRWKAIELVESEAAPILWTLGRTPAGLGSRLIEAADAATVMTDLAAHRDRLAFLRADEVGPGVRALGWAGSYLFGFHRVRSIADWTLQAAFPPPQTAGAVEAGGPGSAATAPAPYDPAATWTMFVGGDLGFDRTVAYFVKNLHKGVNYPYAGGTAKVTGTTCCSAFGWRVPIVVPTGHAGAMRALITSADLALGNMEEPTPDHFTYHSSGTVFTGDPALIAGVAWAGFDVVSCATTHIGDGGRAGILQTVAHLKANGIAAFGCGPNLAAARQPATFEIAGTKVAILGYDAISSSYYGATRTLAGDAPLTEAYVRADIAAARAAGAQVVIVYPHWGTEYQFGPNAFQRRMAHIMIDAGADLVIGNHAHWVQSVEVYRGKPIWYALGNFTFDQHWAEQVLEGVSLELTFRGATLVQARMNPHVLVNAVQPNLLDVATDGQRVLAPVFKASGALLPW
jgi:poly-gamma-glutamate capsule biosynthesis protein CapA/YwtB (metallophosphatase superfamily)